MNNLGLIVFYIAYITVGYFWFKALFMGSANRYAMKIRDFHLNYGFVWARGIIKIICVPLIVKIYITFFFLLMTIAAIMLTFSSK